MTVFSDIYRRNLWNGVESLSGPGSGPSATTLLARDLVHLAADLGIDSFLDAACGDGFWMPDMPGYLGIDVAPEALERAQVRHPERVYLVGDVATLPLGSFDLVFCRDAMQHLPLADGQRILDAIRATGSRWLLASTYIDGQNEDIAAGDFYSPDLMVEPFRLGLPRRLIFDGYSYEEPIRVRDVHKHLGLWAL
jgi:SAM-dependent methyltransferase